MGAVVAHRLAVYGGFAVLLEHAAALDGIDEAVDHLEHRLHIAQILIDLGARGVGLVPRREASLTRNLEEGAEVTASVIDSEMPDGYILLSMRKAAKDKGWEEVQAKLDSGDILEVHRLADIALYVEDRNLRIGIS